MNKIIIQIDLDNTIVDFQSGIDSLAEYQKKVYAGRYDEVEGIFARMKPIDGAIEAVNQIYAIPECDVYICSTAPWENPSAWVDKLNWVKQYLPNMYKRLTLTHHKELVKGNILIDDRTANGAGEFGGVHFQYGVGRYETWDMVVSEVELYVAIHKPVVLRSTAQW